MYISRSVMSFLGFGSLGGISAGTYLLGNRLANNDIEDRRSILIDNEVDQDVKIKEENIVWELVITSSKNKSQEKDFCKVFYPDEVTDQIGCFSNWAKTVKNESGKAELWIRYKKDSNNDFWKKSEWLKQNKLPEFSSEGWTAQDLGLSDYSQDKGNCEEKSTANDWTILKCSFDNKGNFNERMIKLNKR